MNRQQTAAMFGFIRNTYDPRMVMGEPEVIAWQAELAWVTPDEAATAIRAHYRDSTERIMLAHIIGRVRAVRSRQAERRHVERLRAQLPPHDHDRVHAGYLAAKAEAVRAIEGASA